MDINRDITILDINGIGRCCICCNSKDSFHDIDCFIFKCNCILEKCHGLTKTFSSFNKKNSNNLKVPYFKYEKMWIYWIIFLIGKYFILFELLNYFIHYKLIINKNKN